MPERGAPPHLCNSFIYLEIVASLRGLRLKCQRVSARELEPVSFLALTESAFGASASRRKRGKGDYEE
jgi:hypothetical protein